MNNSSLLFKSQIYGFYELDLNGRVIFSRPFNSKPFSVNKSAKVGCDFFKEIFTCKNSEIFKRNFYDFVNGEELTGKFFFRFVSAGKTILLRIMLVKILEKIGSMNQKVICVDIRQN